MESESATFSSDPFARRFGALRAAGRRALVTYITAGHPDPESSLELMRGLEGAGADVMEVGVPFSDPMADGPIIQASSQRALEHGMTLERTLALVERAQLEIPVVLFSYLNPLLAAGSDVLARAARAGVHGILITDLPLGADQERERWLGEGPLAFIRLVAPTTPRERVAEISRHGAGFVYLISRLGVTGVQQHLAGDLPEMVAAVREVASLPVCVGFGISEPEHAAAVARIADGVVVGSALVRAAERGVESALELAGRLRRAMDER